MPSSLEFLVELTMRLALATFIGGIIGLNRDMHGKPAGLRMLGLVALGSALATISVMSEGPIPADAVSRVVQGVLAGVGFLGAGVIMRDETGNVHRLNTAASVWVTAAIGVMCGLGLWALALTAAVLVLVLLSVGAEVDHRFYGRLQKDRDAAD